LDLHISVTADLSNGLHEKARYLSWNSSFANKIMRPDFPNPDPVAVVNQWTWRNLDFRRIKRFRRRYSRFLSKFNGFVVTYPTAFSLLFQQSKLPILAVVAVRYDWPMSRDLDIWESFDSSLRLMHSSGQLTIVANNKADAEYFRCMVGIEIDTVPSFCDYVLQELNSGKAAAPTLPIAPIYLQGQRLSLELCKALESAGVRSASQSFPHGYSWEDLARTSFIFLVPYNISTMTLFELATLGVRVVIPEDEWLIEMFLDGTDGALSELMFEGALWRDPKFGNIPSPESSEEFARWWLSRSDFGNPDLMPNVTRISKTRLRTGFDVPTLDPKLVVLRNQRVKEKRGQLLEKFLQRVGEQ
jgi:hypothetical protein